MNKFQYILLFIALATATIACQKYADVKNETTYAAFKHQDVERSYLIHLPQNYNPKKQYPVIFVLHGITSRAKAIAGFSGFNEQADQKEFIVCYPQGYKRSWEIQIPIGAAAKKEVDDIGFFNQLIDTLSLNYTVDTNKIFACGISNGGFMSALLASKLPKRFSGIAMVCSNLFNPTSTYTTSGNSIPLLLIGGTEDPLLQFEGGKVKGKNKYATTGFRQTVDYWVDKNQCLYPKDSIIIDKNPDDKTRIIKYFSAAEQGKNKVVLYKVLGGGHAWPGREKDFKSNFLGKISTEINAAEVISDFFLSDSN